MVPRKQFKDSRMVPGTATGGGLRGDFQTSRMRGGPNKAATSHQPRGGHCEKGKPPQLRGGLQESFSQSPGLTTVVGIAVATIERMAPSTSRS